MSVEPQVLPPSPEIVGRELDLLGIQGRLQDPSKRLVTLTGPGGVGKSRLALEVAHTMNTEFTGGTRMLRLPASVPSDDADDTVEAVGKAVAGIAPEGRALLLLDGIEHRATRLAPVIAGYLEEMPRLTVLATGQEVLRIYGERVVRVAPLAVPGPLPQPDIADVQDNPAVQLFIRRAQEANPEFSLTAENVAAVVNVCNLLEGVPLILELAARRLRLFPLDELQAWLRRGGDSHRSGPVDAPERQRSLLAIADWSCQGLGAEQRSLLGRLAVFEQGATLATAEAVSPLAAGETSAAIEALLDRNLLMLTELQDAHSRLTMSRTIRMYGLSLLDESGETSPARRAHARHYGKLMQGMRGRFHGSEQQRWLRVAAVEHKNVLAALEYLAVEGDGEECAALVAACLRPWLVRGELKEGLRWFTTAAEELRTVESKQGLLLRARLHTGVGCLTDALGDHDRASHAHSRAVALYKRLRDVPHGARASARLGLALLRCGDRAVGQSLLSAARSTLEAQGDTSGSALAMAGLAEALLAQDQLAQTRELLERAVRIHRQNGEIRDLARTLLISARLSLGERREAAALAELRESLELFSSIGERTELPAALEGFALQLQSGAGQPQRTTRLLAAAGALRQRTGARVGEERRKHLEDVVGGLQRQLGSQIFNTVWLEGLRLPPEAMAAEALAAVEPGRAGEQGEAAVLLTSRQLQVALLVAEGMTNRQVASQLDIAEWTVVNHLRQVMRKLGCSSRVQVAWAVGRRQS